MFKKIIIGTSLLSFSFAFNFNNFNDLYLSMKNNEQGILLENNKHSLIFQKEFPKQEEYKLKLLTDKDITKKYIYNLETKQSKLLCNNPILKKIFYKDNKNKIVYKYIVSDGLHYKTIINKNSCEYLINNNKQYKKDFYKDFNYILNDLVKQLKNKGYFKKISNIDILKLEVKTLNNETPIKLDSITLLKNVTLDEKKKEVYFYNKVLKKLDNKSYQYVLKLTETPNKLKKVLSNFLSKQIKEKKFMKNLIIKDNWKIIHYYNINGETFKIIIDKNNLF